MEESWKRPFEVDGKVYEAVFYRRPFREGLEVRAEIGGQEIRIAELGLGESAVLERLAQTVRQMEASLAGTTFVSA